MDFDYQSLERQIFPSDTQEDERRCIDSLGARLRGEYRILKLLGKGAQGAVFLAEDEKTHEKVAIKQLRIQSVKDWKAYDLFHREADTLKRLDFEGIAKFHAVKEFLDIDEPCALIIQEYIDGEPLQAFISNGHRFSIAEIGDLLLRLLAIVEKLHRSNPPVIHRDIKPSNILLNYAEGCEFPQVHLIDFGAVANPQVKSGGSTVVGTYGYMAPEQLMGRSCAASDIYSIAIVAVYLLSGTPPEKLDVQDFVVLIDPHLEHLPHQITGVLRKMLAPNVDDRLTDFDTIRQFFTALKTQKYDQIPRFSNEIAVSADYALKDVNGYLQAGNIDIWQSLSDDVPRQISKEMRRDLFYAVREAKETRSRPRAKKVKPKRNIRFFLYLTVIMLSLTIIGILVCLCIGFQRLDMTPMLGTAWTLTGMSGFVSWVCILRLFQEVLPLIRKYKKFEQFFRNARKSMATVVRVEFRPYASIGSGDFTRCSEAFYPVWEITYRFNPPDDSSPDDLIRKVRTRKNPKDLKEGSLIPILYLIQHDNDGEHVLATPFPVPYDEISPDMIMDK